MIKGEGFMGRHRALWCKPFVYMRLHGFVWYFKQEEEKMIESMPGKRVGTRKCNRI